MGCLDIVMWFAERALKTYIEFEILKLMMAITDEDFFVRLWKRLGQIYSLPK